jgi:hypothetical protein
MSCPHDSPHVLRLAWALAVPAEVLLSPANVSLHQRHGGGSWDCWSVLPGPRGSALHPGSQAGVVGGDNLVLTPASSSVLLHSLASASALRTLGSGWSFSVR